MTKIAIENRWFRFYDFEISGHEQETENGSGTILQLPAAYVGINELNGQYARLHPKSISVYDEAGKTCGIIRATRYTDLQPRVSSEYWKQIQSSGLWQAGEGKNVYIADDALWYLYNTNPDEYYLKHCVGETGGIFDEMLDEYQARKDQIKQAEAASIKIVRFRLLG